MCQKAGQKVEGVAPVQQRQRDPGREAGRSDQGKADKEPRQQDPGEMRHRSRGEHHGEPIRGTTCKHFQEQGQRDPGRTGKRKGRGRA